jgi:hypothetical protein
MSAAAVVLLEQRVERPQTEPYSRRVLTDGAFEEYSATRVDVSGSTPSFEAQEPRWRRQWQLDEDDLDELRRAIHQSGFAELQPEYRPTGTSIGGSNVTWTALINGKPQAVRLVGAPDVKVSAIEKLEASFNRVLQRAADRLHQR